LTGIPHTQDPARHGETWKFWPRDRISLTATFMNREYVIATLRAHAF
jgi:hypothetical protein